MEAARRKWNCQHQAVRGQGWWYGQHKQTFVKRRDVQRTKDADWFLTVKGRRFLNPPSWAIGTLSAYRKGLSYRVSSAEQGKPVFLLSRKGHSKVIDGSAGNRGRRKRRPLCSGADTGCVSEIDNIAGLRKQADFLLVFHTRKLD